MDNLPPDPSQIPHLDLSRFSQHANRKIDPFRKPLSGTLKPDGTPLDNNRIEIGPTDLAFNEWKHHGLTPPDIPLLRKYRLSRITEQLQKYDYAGVLCFDPINIRYATDSSNMQVWIMHNASRACFVSADGYVILWDFSNCQHLSNHLDLVKEVHISSGFYYFVAGDRVDEKAEIFVDQLEDIMKEHGRGSRRIAVDKIEIPGLRALQKRGFEVGYGQEVMEQARSVKDQNEIQAMRCAINVCETSMKVMEEHIAPGMTEVDAWAILQHENIIRGGEWIETRILSSGPRTNPWYQECGPRIMEEGDLLGFDTDMVSTYGYCADISRTWLVGDKPPSDAQRSLYSEAADFLFKAEKALEPGMTFAEASLACPAIHEKYQKQRYAVLAHGIGLCDEYPEIQFPDKISSHTYSGSLVPGMTLCLEVYFGEVGGAFGVKLEHQVLITESGIEYLSSYPLDRRLFIHS